MIAPALISFSSGLLFSLGLVVSGMTNPDKVIGFLDIFGEWDYALAFVMIGAIGTNALFFKIFMKRKPLCADSHQLPTKTVVDKKLLIGSALFGLGWGSTGICPGPGLVNLATNESAAFLFVASMLIGVFIFQKLEKSWS